MCPRYERAVALLCKKWTGLILRVLMDGPRRFSEFHTQVPELSARLLSDRLQELEEEGVVLRVVRRSHPVRTEYHLTAKGRALAPVIAAIQGWADRWVEWPAADPTAPADLAPCAPGAAVRAARDPATKAPTADGLPGPLPGKAEASGRPALALPPSASDHQPGEALVRVPPGPGAATLAPAAPAAPTFEPGAGNG